MSKTNLISHVAARTDMLKAVAGHVIDVLIDDIKDALYDGGSVTLVGFDMSLVSKRSSCNGRNPRASVATMVGGGKVAKFKPGKVLRDALN